MIYSPRLKKILHYCLTHQEMYISMDELAALLKISKRTIFRELKDVDVDLISYNLRIETKSGKGIRILGEQAHKEELLKELQTQGIAYIDKEERTHLLKFELLHNTEITKLIHYAHMFQVSEATISNDLDAMVPWFESYHITLLRKPGLGVEIHGDEHDVRKAMRDVLHETLQKRSYDEVNYLDSQTLLDQIFIKDDQGSIMRLLNQDILQRILQVFHTYHHELNLDRYVQSSYIGLIIHLVIAIERILKKEEILDNNQVVAMIQEDGSFVQAKNMASLLELEFDIEIPTTEIAFMALHIKGAKINNLTYDDVEHKEYQKLSVMIQKMLQAFDEEICLQLVQDEQLLHGLLTHLEPTIIRLKNQLPIYNPLLSQIKEMYHTLFEQTKVACRVVEDQYSCTVSEDEVGFITMHIGASLERTKRSTIHKREVSIGVVCASGIGVSALLSARIQKLFPYGIHLRVLSMEDILHQRYETCEMLVSTFPLVNTFVEVLCVSPLLTSEDITKLQEALTTLSSKEAPRPAVKQVAFMDTLQGIQKVSIAMMELMEHIFVSVEEPMPMGLAMMKKIASDHGDKQQRLYEDLKAREALGSVIMKDYEFMMYHTKSQSISHNLLHFYYPKEEHFLSMEGQPMKFLIAMLRKEEDDSIGQSLLALVSRSLIEHVAFYNAISTRNVVHIKEVLSELLHEYMITYVEEHL